MEFPKEVPQKELLSPATLRKVHVKQLEFSLCPRSWFLRGAWRSSCSLGYYGTEVYPDGFDITLLQIEPERKWPASFKQVPSGVPLFGSMLMCRDLEKFPSIDCYIYT